MKTKLILLIVLSLSVFVANAQSNDTIHIWQGAVPGETNPKHKHVTGTNKKDNSIIYTEITDPTYVVYKPEVSKSNGCAVIVCSGGGYGQIGTMSDVAEWLNKQGFTAFTLQYRVPGKRAGALMDIQRTIRIIRSKSSDYKIDPNRLGVIGLSAGGNLCAKSCTSLNVDTYPKTDALDTISCCPNYAILLYPAYLDKGENGTLSPEISISKSTPHMFVCVATNDKNHYHSSVVFTEALRKANVPLEYHEFPEGGHGFIFQEGNPAAQAWPDMAETWLKNIIKH